MDLERLSVLIDAYGVDPRRWPAQERQAAEALLAASAAAQERLRGAARLDQLLSTRLPEIEPSAVLRNRILASVKPQSRPVANWRMQLVEALAVLFPRGQATPQFAVLALALAIGIGAGVANVDLDVGSSDLTVQLAAAANPVYFEE